MNVNKWSFTIDLPDIADFCDVEELLDLAHSTGNLIHVEDPIPDGWYNLHVYEIWGHRIVVRMVNWKMFHCGRATYETGLVQEQHHLPQRAVE